MLDTLLNWLTTDQGYCLTFGFSAYMLFTIWRKLSARWVNWFPLAAKAMRLILYVAAAAVAILAFVVLGIELSGTQKIAFIGIGAGLGPLLNLVARQLRRQEKLRRGASVGAPAEVNKLTSKQLPGSDFTDSFKMGGVTIPRSAEPYHFFVVGSTGSGKSVAITGLLDHLEARGDIALVVDSGGEFCSRYYRPGRDRILNPFDDRCAPWSPTAEMTGPWDAEALAKSMIPDGVGESKEWNGYAQTLVTSVLRQLHDRGELSIKKLLYYVQAAPIDELTPLLAGTAAAGQLVSDKTFGSIRTIASKYLATYAYLEDSNDPFSVADFIRAENPGFLFMTYRDDQLDSLRDMISCALDVAARTILALPANSQRRVWLIIDEFASIGKVQSIEAIATKARKMGGCLLIGLQSVSQLKDRYGEHAAQTILSCLSSWLVLRCSDADTAEYVSKYIGEAEVSRMTRGESSSDTGGSASLSEQIQTQRAVMPVELQRLANLQGFFKLAGDYPICNIKLSFPKKRDKAAVNYATRDFVAKPMLKLIDENATAPQGEHQAPTASVDNSHAEQSAQEEAPTPVPAETPRPRLNVRRNPFDAGPEALEDLLNEMADSLENGA